MARILASATAGLAPEDLFIAPAEAIPLAVGRAGLSMSEIELFEINEAFAVQMLACLQRLGLSEERVNVHGGAIALGHPIGASGARVTVTLLHALRQRRARYGVAALCLGGGNAVAAVFENLALPH
jgi:acetyl-CoA C-acetyltransferase